MKSSNSRRRFLALLAGGVLATVIASQSFAAKKPVQVVTGVYTGTAISTVEDPAEEVDVLLVLENGKNRKLVGTVQVEEDTPIELKGTISASGQVNLQGKTPDGPKVTLKGKFAVDPDTADRSLEGTYQLSQGGDRGTFGVIAPPAL